MNKDISLEKLLTLYTALSEICQDYSRMTDGYSLATGNIKFEDIPEDIREMIKERQEFFAYRGKIKAILKERILEEMRNYE